MSHDKGETPFLDPQAARTPEQREWYERILEHGSCPFCHDFCEGQDPEFHPYPILQANRSWVVTQSYPPYEGTSLHLLFVLKRHTECLDLNGQEASDYFALVRWCCAEFGLDYGVLLTRFGPRTELTGSSVKHLHSHLIVGDTANPDHIPIRVKVSSALNVKAPP